MGKFQAFMLFGSAFTFIPYFYYVKHEGQPKEYIKNGIAFLATFAFCCVPIYFYKKYTSTLLRDIQFDHIKN
jgi:hypothetical protein